MKDEEKWREKPVEGENSAGRDGNELNEPGKRRRITGRTDRISGRTDRGNYENGNVFGVGRSYNRNNSSYGQDRRNSRSGSSYGDRNGDRNNRSYQRSYDRNDRGGSSREDNYGNKFFSDRNRDNSHPYRSFNNNNRTDRTRRPSYDYGRRPGGRSEVNGNSFDNSYRRGGDRNNDRNYNGQPRRPHFSGPTLPDPSRADGRPRRRRITTNRNEEVNVRPKYSVSINPDEEIRLNKFLANAGICSRREADEFIKAGVIKVNGEVVSELGVKVKPTDAVLFHDQKVSLESKVYILLNKPKDCVTTSDDPQERLTVMDLVKGACFERIYPVGRLDRNTTGVLLLTNDGDLASKLTHPKYEKRKIYQVTLNNSVTEADMKKIIDGIELEDGVVKADNVNYLDDERKSIVGIEIHSGQNRVVRRIFESLGYKVYKLDRVYFAGLTKKNLPRGRWRYLTEKEVSLLKMGAFL